MPTLSTDPTGEIRDRIRASFTTITCRLAAYVGYCYQRRSTAAMEEGVKHSRCFVLFLTGDAPADGVCARLVDVA